MSPEERARHGTYDPARGWYSAATGYWHNDPKKIGRLSEPVTVTDDHQAEYARQQAKARGDFRADPQMDKLLALRDSDRAADRAKFERIATGTTAMSLGDYEARKNAAEEGGR